MVSMICPCSPIWEFVWLPTYTLKLKLVVSYSLSRTPGLMLYLLYSCQGDDARQAMASHSLNNVLTAARPASCMLCNSSSPSSQIDLASFNSCTAYCHVTGVIWGRHQACYQFGLSTLKQMKCLHRNICPNLTENSNATIFSVQEFGVVAAKRYASTSFDPAPRVRTSALLILPPTQDNLTIFDPGTAWAHLTGATWG
uniref:Uncharacterized protein n=2 Tax=Triticum urartu TaxID=4572 RepID=A0A8R7V0J1_TRIUA